MQPPVQYNSPAWRGACHFSALNNAPPATCWTIQRNRHFPRESTSRDRVPSFGSASSRFAGRGLRPGLVGVECRHLASNLSSRRPEILLIDDAVMVHDERHDSRVIIFGRERHERKSSNHVTACDVVICPTVRV